MAARDLLSLVLHDLHEQRKGPTSTKRALISEWHEDWIIVNGDDQCVVSAKHREADQNAWTWATLMSDGGIPRLYRSFRGLAEGTRCRLATNNAITTGRETHALRNTCLLDHEGSASPREHVTTAERTTLVRTLARYLQVHHDKAGLTEEESRGRSGHVNQCRPSPSLVASAERFLDSLALDTGIPDRRTIVDSGPLRYVKPVLEQLGHPTIRVEAVWEALTGYVEQSMESMRPHEDGGLAELVRFLREEHPRPGTEALERRTITTDQALRVIDQAVATPRLFLAPSLPFRHKVSVKMTFGGLEANHVQRAEDRMLRWRKSCASEVDDSPGNHAQLLEFGDELEDQVDDLHLALRRQGLEGSEFGMRLWHDATRLPPEDLPPLPFRLTRSLLTGALADASDQCRVWFTPYRFDADRILLESARVDDGHDGANADEEDTP
ncbi:hypothetical protein [Nocardiopsis aegyptia]|uniref:DUF4297 domain-containing protein n=1 Tax=Nocardiopsis aegyptia TaxID=220378 RepID=A0A7Z0EK03_9ACTN|nr:hypothetical protein [Nocardiopsis aegyptia]NYJ33021.1 hypothetical protein [Nocardiopsis aegyptia]